METEEWVASQEVDLSNCDREAIHIPGSIQPHGVLLVLQDPQLKILQASKNTEEFFGIPVQSLIDQHLSVLFAPSQLELLTNCILQENPEIFNPLKFSVEVQQESLIFDGIIHRSDSVLILELEPESALDKNSGLSFYSLVKYTICKLKKTSNFRKKTEVLVKEIRKVTGYDRVMIYRFEPDESGVVIAEDKREELEPYLNLHYPASDIPKQARKLYYENWLRLIVDMNYQRVEIIPANNPITGYPLDLSLSILRSVSPMHVEYSQNMGVSASLCISLINEEKLWGLIVFHHYSPKNIDYNMRNYCELVGQLMSVELVEHQNKEADNYREKINLIQHELRQKISGDSQVILDTLEQNSRSLLNLVKATGAAIYLGDNMRLIGETPPREAVFDLLTWLLNHCRQEVFFTNSISQYYPKAKEFKSQASGLLAISIFVERTSYSLLWFRPEVIQTVNWGGNPNKPVLVDEKDGSLRLSPRRSFELWKETVREKSLPWQQVEIDAALELRNTLMLAVLEFSQAALQEAAKRAQVANRAKSQFLAKMSHELRTPLNAILGFTQVMTRDKALSKEQIDYLRIINRSGEHLLSLINDVLEMSKIEAGKLTLNENSFDLYRVLDSIEEMLQLKASAKGLQLVFNRTPEVPQYVIADEGKLRQVLINLLGNAIKFTEAGRVTLRVVRELKVERLNVEGSQEELKVESSQDNLQPDNLQPANLQPDNLQPVTLKFEVEDTGPGIAADELDTIFDAFVQTETGRHSMQGTGLGLPISRQFIRLMGGDISVRSVVGQGSTFTFNIQVYLAEEADMRTASTTRRIIGLEPNQPRYRILVVEDVEENRLLLVKLLESVGFEVRSAENGREAIALWNDWQPHLIWMDMLMPVMDGYEATKQIKATLKGQATVIIALTAHAFSEERSAILDAGCDDFVPKPFQGEVLLEKMARHLGVRYRYEQEQAPPPQSGENAELLTPEALTVMPKEWLEQLHQAAEACLEEEALALIEQIPEQHTALKLALTHLIDNFRFDIIIDLT